MAGGSELAGLLGVSELIIGLTVISAGTSLPEIATSVWAALKGEREIAVGNVVGSTILNVVLVMGLASVSASGGVPVPAAAIAFDLPIMVAVTAVCLPIFYSGYIISRAEGGLLLGWYLAYAAALFLVASAHGSAPGFNHFVLTILLPVLLVLVTLPAARQAWQVHTEARRARSRPT